MMQRTCALLLSLGLVVGCARADASRKDFDVGDQPAGAALNEFARQADITLIFSYDLVADVRIQPLRGRYTVTDGLSALLSDTGLDYQEVERSTFSICRKAACGKPQ